MLQDIFKAILVTSFIGTALTLVLTLIKPITKKWFASSWHYYMWLVVLISMVLPIRISIPEPTQTVLNAETVCVEQNETIIYNPIQMSEHDALLDAGEEEPSNS